MDEAGVQILARHSPLATASPERVAGAGQGGMNLSGCMEQTKISSNAGILLFHGKACNLAGMRETAPLFRSEGNNHVQQKTAL